MIRRTIAIAAALCLFVVPVAFGGTKTVEVGDDFFKPTDLKIKKDTRVAFEWTGINVHDVVKVKGPGPFFESGPIDEPGVQFKRKFKKAGTYKLICSIHDGMKMKLEVTKPRN